MIVSKTYIKKRHSNQKIEIEIQYDQHESYLKLISKELGEKEWDGLDLLDAFVKMRKYIESMGYLIFVNGSRKNSWASGFLRDSSNGLLTYIFNDNNIEHKTIVNIFDFYPNDIVAYEEQKEFYDSLRKNYRDFNKKMK